MEELEQQNIEKKVLKEKGEVVIERNCLISPDWANVHAVLLTITPEILGEIIATKELLKTHKFLNSAEISASSVEVEQLDSTIDDPEREVIEDTDFVTDFHTIKVYSYGTSYFVAHGKHDGSQFYEVGLEIDHLLEGYISNTTDEPS